LNKPRTVLDVRKRTRDTIIRALLKFEAKYGEASLRIVVNKFYAWKRVKKNALKQREKLEETMERVNKEISKELMP